MAGKLKCVEDARSVITAALTLNPDAGADDYMPLVQFRDSSVSGCLEDS